MDFPSSSKPNVCPAEVIQALDSHYGLQVEVNKELKSFSAQNYLVSSTSHDMGSTKKLLAKILNSEEAPNQLLEWRFSVMDQLRSQGFCCQKLIHTKSGDTSVLVSPFGELKGRTLLSIDEIFVKYNIRCFLIKTEEYVLLLGLYTGPVYNGHTGLGHLEIEPV